MSKLWIIGDSFTGLASCGNPSWPEIVSNKFNGGKYYVSSRASRDFQTILDIFLRNLKSIEKDDFVILVVPFLGRTRLPLQTAAYDTQYSNFVNKFNTFDYFIGTQSYTNDSEEYKLESPLTYCEQNKINKDTEIWSIVNSSESSKKNWIEILKSLKEYLPFEIFIWSWENEIESDIIVSKKEIEAEIGFWHTYKDLYNETNGAEGSSFDMHFSSKMHQAFANYIINKFPQFFENE